MVEKLMSKGVNRVKRLNVSITEELHKELRVAVAESSTTIVQFVTDAIAEKIKNNKEKKEEAD